MTSDHARPAPRRLTTARLVALLAIAAVAATLGYLHIHRDDAKLAVPAGAHAGQLTLKPCTYGADKGELEADCGTLVVPENRRDPSSRLIALPVKRIRARSAQPAEPIFRLEGGPGKTNMDFPFAGRYVDRHDLVVVGYRGVDGSSKLDCPEVESARLESGDLLSQRSLRASADAFGSCARRLTGDGVDLAGYSLAQRVDDLEAARRALGYGRVDLLSESAGTRTAMIYAWRYPQSIRRSVMVGVNPPGHFVWRPEATTAQLRRFSALCAKQASCPQRSEDFDAAIRRTAADMPDRWGFLPIRRGNVLLASFIGLMEASSDAEPASAPITLDAWRAVSRGDASGLWFQSMVAELLLPRIMVWGDVASVARADAAVAAEHFSSARGDRSPVGDAGNRFLWASGELLRRWPASTDDEAYRRLRTSKVETLLIGGTLDGATPLGKDTRELLRRLPNGHQVKLAGFGHTTDFWNRQSAAGTHLITTFLDTGEVDASRYTRQRVDFTPGLRQTTLAKGLAGSMVVLALVAVLSLLGTAMRVRSRGRIGPKASAYLRSAHLLVVGLGGWLAGTLVALTLLPDAPIEGENVVVPSVGLSIGLAVHLAWLQRDRPAATRLAGLVAAVAGAVVGARLGFECASAPLAALTAIPGAAALANLTVIAVDLATARAGASSPRRQLARASSRAAASPRSSAAR